MLRANSLVLIAATLVGFSAVAHAQTPPAGAPAVPPDATTPAEPTDAAAEPAVEPAALPEPTPAPEPEPAPAPEPPKKLTVGKGGLFQPGFLGQGWFLFDKNGDTKTSTFRIRRAEMHMKGEIIPGQVSYAIMADFAKVLEFGTNADGIKQPVSNVSAFQDVYMTYMTEYADISLGQFKIPVSWEGYNSSSKLLFPERSLVARAYGDKRDLGIRITKTFPKFMYSAGVWNGQGLNNLDTNNAKDVGLRLEYYPIKGLTVAGVAYGQLGERDLAGTKDRFEADVRYESGPMLFQSEYIHARDVNATGDGINADGLYAAFAYMVDEHLQPALRVGYLDPDSSQNLPGPGSDEVLEITGGLCYYLRAQEAKVQLVYSRFQFDDNDAIDEVLALTQISF